MNLAMEIKEHILQRLRRDRSEGLDLQYKLRITPEHLATLRSEHDFRNPYLALTEQGGETFMYLAVEETLDIDVPYCLVVVGGSERYAGNDGLSPIEEPVRRTMR